MSEPNRAWRCFHCDEVFHDRAAAAEHFGATECQTPVCQISAERIRLMEHQLAEYREDDTPLHRRISALEGERAAAVQRAEELGYERGLRDAHKARDARGVLFDGALLRAGDADLGQITLEPFGMVMLNPSADLLALRELYIREINRRCPPDPMDGAVTT